MVFREKPLLCWSALKSARAVLLEDNLLSSPPSSCALEEKCVWAYRWCLCVGGVGGVTVL